MGAPGWLTRCLADVPADDRWLGPAERRTLAGLTVGRRRADWRLGRWTAKAAVGAWVGVSPARVQVLAAADGAPEAWIDGRRAPVSVSLSHRAGRALAAVTDGPAVVGCDLELVEPRSDAFVREWLAPSERRRLAAEPLAARDRLANLMWSAKEAAAKVAREGLRLDVRHAVVDAGGSLDGAAGWRVLRIDWTGARPPTAGWWRAEPGWVMTLAGVPTPDRPEPIEERV